MTYPFDNTSSDDEQEQAPDEPPDEAYEKFVEEMERAAQPLTPAEQEAALDEQIEQWEELESNRGFGEPDEFRDDLM